ncbi:SDR family NAD(P)-dependent oxidoreductase [Pseudomonadota bacterium]
MKKGIPDLDGKVAVVTGAANGIGRSLAILLKQKGCHLALIDIDRRSLDKLALDLEAHRPSRKISTHVVDVTEPSQMKRLADEVIGIHGHVHVLFNNAGIAYEGPFTQTSLDTWQHLMGVNLWGTVYGCLYFMPHLAKVERAHIVNLSSLFGLVGMAGQTAYSTSKFAITGFSDALREELRITSIGLSVIHPGAVDTNIMKNADSDDPQLMERLSAWYEQNALAPEKAAVKIIAAVESGKPRVRITREVFFADYLKRLLPVSGNKFICDLIIKILKVEDMREKRITQWRRTMIEDHHEKG